MERNKKKLRLIWWSTGLAGTLGMVYLMATANMTPVDPTEIRGPQSHTSVVLNSAAIVFREGLEAVLIFAAITASFRGASRAKRRPVVLGALGAFAITILTWLVFDLLLNFASPLGPRLEAITGFLAIVVLLIVLNWFAHQSYWTGWISRHHRQRRKLLGKVGLSATVGLIALGFTSVYREGFEVVLFLQSLKLKTSSTTVLEGVALGLLGSVIVGIFIFFLHQRLPYRKMLIATGGLVGFVLLVMIGGTALSFQTLGWLPRHPTPFEVPAWMSAWFEIYASWKTIGAQLLAGTVVIGSYIVAERLRKRHRSQRQLKIGTTGELVTAKTG